jgi:hypothetical protein
VLVAGKLDCILRVLDWAAAGAGAPIAKQVTASAATSDTALEPLFFFDTLHPPKDKQITRDPGTNCGRRRITRRHFILSQGSKTATSDP